jgi:hypothetical protein
VEAWQGALVAAPMCMLLGLLGFSKALTGIVVALSIVLITAYDDLSEPAKKLAGIFVVWCVIDPAATCYREGLKGKLLSSCPRAGTSSSAPPKSRSPRGACSSACSRPSLVLTSSSCS